MERTRYEQDSLGRIAVPASAYWGAQTQRSLRNFPFAATERMPITVIHALALIKRAAARFHLGLGMPPDIAEAIDTAATEVSQGQLDDHFPLAIWQTGSGTQTNMNVNEVIAGRANELLAGKRGGTAPVHPNDHVNRGQSSNDCFPTALHLAIALATRDRLLPAIDRLRGSFAARARAWKAMPKLGRTHLQDAAPLTLGQEFSGLADQLGLARARVWQALETELMPLAQGGTAVGTGLNAEPGLGAAVIGELAERTGLPLLPAANPFAASACHDPLQAFGAALAVLATALTKISNDLRLLASGPDGGIGELRLPANEPGSSIMAGKVNPTQCEMVAMVAAQVLGNQQAVMLGNLQGQLQLNTFKPLIGAAILRSIDLLATACESFALRCVDGIEPDLARIEQALAASPMIAAALVPVIGYARTARLVAMAREQRVPLRRAAELMGLESELDLDRLLDPARLV